MRVPKPLLDRDIPDVALGPDDQPIGEALAQHHRGLERALAIIVGRVRKGGPALRRSWDVFERELATHLALEERDLFPWFERFHAGAVRELRAEHDVIRKTLAEVTTALDLNRLADAALVQLATHLREHAVREEQVFYPWTERHLSREVRPPLEREATGAARLADRRGRRN